MTAQEPSKEPSFLPIEQAARLLGVSSKTLRRWDEKQILSPMRTPGGQRRYSTDQLEGFLLQRKKSRYAPAVPTTTTDAVAPTSRLQAYTPPPTITHLHSPLSLKKAGIPKKPFFDPTAFAQFLTHTKLVASILLVVFLGFVGLGLLRLAAVEGLFTSIPGVFFHSNNTDNNNKTGGDVLAAQISAFPLTGTIGFNLPVLFGNGLNATGSAIFNDPITAPNVIYSVTGSNGINVTAGQNPVVSLSTPGTGLTLTGGALTNTDPGSAQNIFKTIKIGSTDISAGSNTDTFTFTAGSNITLSTDTTNKKVTIAGSASSFSGITLAGTSGTNQTISDGDTLTIAAGNGITTTGAATDKLTVGLDVTTAGVTATSTTVNSGLEVATDGLSLLRSCSDAQVLQWDATNGYWKCAASGSLSGTGTAGRVAYWSTSTAIASNANFINFSDSLFSNVGQISLGSAVQSTGTAFVVMDNPAISATANQNFYKTLIDNTAAVTVPTGTASIVASLAIDEPNITATGTVTNASTLYISDAPTEGSSGNFAVWVDNGATRFEYSPLGTATAPDPTVNIVPAYGINAADQTLTGLRIALDTNSNTDAEDIGYALDIANITSTSGPTETAIRIGSGYDNQFFFELGSNDLTLNVTAPSGGSFTATVPAISANDNFCMVTVGNCFGSGSGGSGATYTSQATNALTKFTSTTGQITASNLSDDGTTVTIAANKNLALADGTGSFTQTYSPAGSTSTANGFTLTPKFTLDVTNQTLSGIYINPNTNLNNDTEDVLNGILIDAITASSATEYGLQIGSGWDQNLYLNDTSTNVLLADGGTITISDGTNTLCTVTDAGTTGNLSCSGTISSSGTGAVGYWSKSSTTLSPATANDIVSIANTTTTGADLAITNTGVYTGTGILNLTANSASSGDIALVSGTALTTGSLLTLTGPTGATAGVTDAGLKISSDVGNIGTSNGLISSTAVFDGSSATGVNLYLTSSDAVASGNTNYGIYNSVTNTGVTSSNKTIRGIYSTVSNTGASGGTQGTLAGYFNATGDTGGTSNVYGVDAEATGGDSNFGVLGIAYNSTAATQANNYGGYFSAQNSSTGTLTNAYGVYATGLNLNASGTIDTFYGIYSANPTNSGTLTTNYGLYVVAHTSGTSDYGARIDAADTQTVWISGNADNTTAAAGIAFGSSRDTNLYRSAADTLKTDDSMVVGGTSLTVTGVEGSDGLILSAGDAAISNGSLSIIDNDNAASFSLTNNTVTTVGAGVNTDGLFDLSSSSLTTGNLMNLETTTTLTTGKMLNISSTSTALTTGNLLSLDWSPGSATAATGDLFKINIGANATTFAGNLLNVLDNGSSLFAVSKTQTTSSLPLNVTAPGDVSIAYDINFTNPTVSFIKSAAPIVIQSGETFSSSDLTLKTFGLGAVVVDSGNSTATTTASSFVISAPALTSGTAAYINSDAITTGKLLDVNTGSTNTLTTGTLVNIASSATSQTSASLLSVAQTGATTGVTGTVVALSTTASTNSSAKLLGLTANSMTTGTALNLSATALTTGTALNIAGSTAQTTGASLAVSGGRVSFTPTNTIASGASVTWDGFTLPATTATLTGSTNITTATGFNLFNIAQPTLSAGTALTVTNAATMYIANAPAASGAGPATITNAYSLWVDAGAARFDGAVAIGAQQTLTPDSTTPSVAAGSHFITANTTGTLISNFTAGHSGQIIAIEIGDTTTDLDFSASNLKGSGVDNTTTTTGDFWYFISDGTNWNLISFVSAAGTQTGVDIAELFVSSETLEAGDVVSIDQNNDIATKKTTASYDKTVMGIIATKPGIILQDGPAAENMYPVALAGRVPVKVSTENGPIQKGDYLTSSTIPGIAMKATRPGPVIGKAMESYSGSGIGKVVVFVNVSFADPQGTLANLSLDANGNLVIPTTTVIANEVKQSPPSSDVLGIASSSATPRNDTPASQSAQLNTFDLSKDQLFTDLTTRIDLLDKQLQTLQQSVLSSASSSAFLQQATNSANLDSMNNELRITNDGSSPSFTIPDSSFNSATVSGQLTVVGRTVVNDLSVLGNLNAGLLSFDTLSPSINTLSGDLKFQETGLGGINFLSGKVVITKNGDVKTEGTVTAKKINIDESDDTARSAGEAVLLAGKTKVVITTTSVTANSRIFVTPKTMISLPLAVTTQTAEKSFVVEIPLAQSKDVKFNWWIIN